MHAGTGIVHSEYNLERGLTTFFQIWILPDRRGVAPGWGARQFPRGGGLAVLASGRGRDNGTAALPLYADAALMAGTLAAGETATLALDPGRGVYLVPASGSVTANGVHIGTRDGAAISDERKITLTASENAEIVLVEVSV